MCSGFFGGWGQVEKFIKRKKPTNSFMNLCVYKKLSFHIILTCSVVIQHSFSVTLKTA